MLRDVHKHNAKNIPAPSNPFLHAKDNRNLQNIAPRRAQVRERAENRQLAVEGEPSVQFHGIAPPLLPYQLYGGQSPGHVFPAFQIRLAKF